MPAQTPPMQPDSLLAEAQALVSALTKRLVGAIDESSLRSGLEEVGLTLVSFDKDAGTALVGVPMKIDTAAAGR